ncbi:MAG: hypothetical protein JEY99_03715 [Spirochaetales bacterium]|nr:hypothetical protein [Spirochaetales bacterium]
MLEILPVENLQLGKFNDFPTKAGVFPAPGEAVETQKKTILRHKKHYSPPF